MFSRKVICLVGRSLLRNEFHAIRHGYFNKLPLIRTYQLPSTTETIPGTNEERSLHNIDTPLKGNETDWQKEFLEGVDKNPDLHLIRQVLFSLKTKEIGVLSDRDLIKKILDKISIHLKDNSTSHEFPEKCQHLIDCCQVLLELKTPMVDMKEIQRFLLHQRGLMTDTNLISLMTVCVNHYQFGCLFNTKSTIMKMWSDCCYSQPKKLLLVLKLLGRGGFHKNQDVENKILMSIPYMAQDDIVSFIQIMSRHNIRIYNVLILLTDKLTKDGLKLMNIEDYSSLLYSFHNLSIYPISAISRICECLNILKSFEVKENILLSIIRSLAALGYKDQETLNNICQKLLEDFSTKDPKLGLTEFSHFLYSLAMLNFIPDANSEHKNLLSLVHKSYNTGIWNDSPVLWLNVVWSMAVLNLADGIIIDSVLNENFSRLLEAKNGGKMPRFLKNLINIKLMNLDCAAKCDLENYTGSRLTRQEGKTSPIVLQASKSIRRLILDVVFVSNRLAENEKCVGVTRLIPEGYVIDVEFLVDSKGKPLPLDEDVKQDEHQKKHKIALKLVGFDALMKSQPEELKGNYVIELRHLKKLGYKVVEIHHNQWPLETDIEAKIQFLKTKISEVIPDS